MFEEIIGSYEESGGELLKNLNVCRLDMGEYFG